MGRLPYSREGERRANVQRGFPCTLPSLKVPTTTLTYTISSPLSSEFTNASFNRLTLSSSHLDIILLAVPMSELVICRSGSVIRTVTSITFCILCRTDLFRLAVRSRFTVIRHLLLSNLSRWCSDVLGQGTSAVSVVFQ